MCRLGWLTVSEPDPEVGGLFVAWATAVFMIVPDVWAVVGLVMWTLTDPPGARSPNEQFKVCCAGAMPEIEHVPGPVYAGLIDQLRPGATGSVSERVTLVAVPVVLAL